MTEPAYEYIEARRTLLDARLMPSSHTATALSSSAPRPCTCTQDPPV
jgi:hypothetical protein